MAASSVARSMASFLSVAALLIASGIIPTASAQSVTTSNSTLTASESNSIILLTLTGGSMNNGRIFELVPLTAEAGLGGTPTGLASIHVPGQLQLVGPSSINLTTSDIALISCDPNGGNISPSDVLVNTINLHPKGIILYSLQAQECNLTGTDKAIYSMTSARDSNNLITLVTMSTNVSALLSGNSTTSSLGSQPSSDGAPAPTTAVAMSILYSITGIITLLFLVIIATGAVRAHRHPERYGPRNGVLGRPRQSRAKGLARAMLETLPIVKFGDPEPVKPGGQEIELEDGQSQTQHERDVVATSGVQPPGAGDKSTTMTTALPAAESGLGAAQAKSPGRGEEPAKEGELGCSICTEDFTTGEDVRVLPCNHKYHPACIDPWLLNVSGTCPLCRHDLRPVTSATSNTENTGATGATDELPPPLSVHEGAEGHAASTNESVEGDRGHGQRRRISRFLDLNRLRHAPPDERIAALRSLRQESQQETSTTAVTADDTEERSRRARLTGRLRDTFRIRTGAETSNPSSSS